MVCNTQLHILPREIMGISTFGLSMFLMRWLSMKYVDNFLILCARILLGDTEKIGLKRPKIGPLQFKMMSGKTPVLDVGTLAKIKNGEIKVVHALYFFCSYLSLLLLNKVLCGTKMLFLISTSDKLYEKNDLPTSLLKLAI
jgi:hypothetical protein